MIHHTFDCHIGSLLCEVADFNVILERPEAKPTLLSTHQHPSWELFCVFGGHLMLTIGPHTYRVEAGQLLLLPPATYHYMASSSPDFDGMAILFSLTRAKNVPVTAKDQLLLDLFQPSSPVLRLPISFALAQSLDLLRRTALDDPSSLMHTERLCHLYSLALLDLFDHLNPDHPSSPAPAKANEIPYLHLIDDFFSQTYNRHATRQMLADQLHISVRQLNRILKKHYGMTFYEKLQEIRLKNAIALLQATTLPLSSVAEQLGFSSQSAFSAFIRATTGQTPSQIRTKTG